MGNMKGTGWLGCMEYVQKTFGSDGFERVQEKLTPEDRELIFARRIMPTDWLDYGAFIRMMRAADEVLGKGDLELVAEASRYDAHKDLRGVYKVFLSMLSPRLLANKAPNIWGRYFDEGVFTVHWQDDEHVVFKLADYPDIPLHHNVPHMAYMGEALKIAGAKNLVVKHPTCMARGDDHCDFDLRWE